MYGYKDAVGFFHIMGRINDVINVSGHRLNTCKMEEIVATQLSVAECAYIGITGEFCGQRPIALVVVKDHITHSEDLIEESLINLLREKIGPIAFFKNAAILKRLPKQPVVKYSLKPSAT